MKLTLSLSDLVSIEGIFLLVFVHQTCSIRKKERKKTNVCIYYIIVMHEKNKIRVPLIAFLPYKKKNICHFEISN